MSMPSPQTCPGLVVLENCGAAVREAARPAGAAAEDAGGRLEAATAAVVVPKRNRGGRLPAAGGRVRTTAENVVFRGEKGKRDAHTFFQVIYGSWVLRREVYEVHCG